MLKHTSTYTHWTQALLSPSQHPVRADVGRDAAVVLNYGPVMSTKKTSVSPCQ